YVGAPATISQALVERRQGVPDEVVQIANRALRRLRRKASLLMMRKKSATKVATALARELAGFIWAAALATKGLPKPSTIVVESVASSKRKDSNQSPAKPRRIA